MYKVPILATGKKPCRKYVLELEAAIVSDGCTVVTEVYHECCIIHDLGYRFGIDCYGHPIDRATTDANFRKCIQSKSFMKWFSPISWLRWAGVRAFGWKFYPKTIPSFETYIYKP